jgi:hypothetical protein
MNTVQEPLTNSVFPPPCSIETPAELHPGNPPTNKVTTSQNQLTINAPVGDRQTGPFSANAYHVPPTRYAPKPHSYRYDDTLDLPPDTTPLPERCQFMFSDGRQCTMGRSEIHPSLCPYHSEREDQLFGTPSSGGSVVGASFDLPELYSACRDLTTAASVSRALGQVFRLLAQRRISRQEAATFAKLGHLLLQSISAVHSSRESLSAANVYPQDELRGANKGHQELSRAKRVYVPSFPRADLAAPRSSVPTLAAAPPAQQAGPSPKGADTCSTPSTPQPPPSVNSSGQTDVAVVTDEPSATQPPPPLASIKQQFPTESPVAHNQRRINTYENTEVKTVHNEHLRKKRRAV